MNEYCVCSPQSGSVYQMTDGRTLCAICRRPFLPCPDHPEIKRLVRFHDDIVAAFGRSREVAAVKRPGEKTQRHTFFAGQRLRRLVREAVQRFDADAPDLPR